MDLQSLNLSSISGIVIATTFLVELVKKHLSSYAWAKKIPVFVYSGAIAVILAFIANKVLRTPDGSPLLGGSTYSVMWAALLAALSSSGFYTWLRNPETIESAADTGDTIVSAKLLIVGLVMSASALGCANPEKAALRDSMDGGTRTIRAQHKDWSHKLMVDPTTGQNHADQLPKLTKDQVDNLDLAHKEYEDLVAKDKANDTAK